MELLAVISGVMTIICTISLIFGYVEMEDGPVFFGGTGLVIFGISLMVALGNMGLSLKEHQALLKKYSVPESSVSYVEGQDEEELLVRIDKYLNFTLAKKKKPAVVEEVMSTEVAEESKDTLEFAEEDDPLLPAIKFKKDW
jgi:hypothetical protein